VGFDRGWLGSMVRASGRELLPARDSGEAGRRRAAAGEAPVASGRGRGSSAAAAECWAEASGSRRRLVSRWRGSSAGFGRRVERWTERRDRWRNVAVRRRGAWWKARSGAASFGAPASLRIGEGLIEEEKQ